MSEVRKERTFDGRCTVFAGSSLIISNLSDETADHVLAQLSRGPSPATGSRNVGGRDGGKLPKSQGVPNRIGQRAS